RGGVRAMGGGREGGKACDGGGGGGGLGLGGRKGGKGEEVVDTNRTGQYSQGEWKQVTGSSGAPVSLVIQQLVVGH
ncbi:MAG: Nuclear pore complex protein-Nup96 precursor, partial [Colwellia sp.]|nr:Nuclear pore complex protein-Nup96 precursor [Colwellia sp.]